MKWVGLGGIVLYGWMPVDLAGCMHVWVMTSNATMHYALCRKGDAANFIVSSVMLYCTDKALLVLGSLLGVRIWRHPVSV